MLWDCGSPLVSNTCCAAEAKHEQPMAQGGPSSRGPQCDWVMTYWPYTQAELVDLGKKFWQKQGETLAAWLLWLWDTGVGPEPVGGLQVLLREVEGRHADTILKMWRTQRGPELPRVSSRFLRCKLGLICAKVYWRRQWHPTPALLPGKSHGRRSLVGRSPWGRWKSDKTQWLHFDFSLSCIGEGNGNPLQCSCLENPRDRGASWAAVYGVTQSLTRLKQLSSSSSSIL